jgi:hypothetical protein
MIKSFIARLLSSARDADADDKDPITKRSYVRHEAADCTALIRGQSFPVVNWSFGGAVILADDGIFSEGQVLYMTLRFRLLNSNLEIVHQGTVIRSAGRRTAIRFDALKPHVSRGFQKVVEDNFARRRAKERR